MKKSLALMLALIMVLCMIPTTAFAEAGDWDPLTDPNTVAGSLVGKKTFSASTTMEAGKDGYLRIMPTLDAGNNSYNAMAYCGAKATSNNTSIVEVKSIEIGKWVGGVWNNADCLQVTVNPKAAGTTTVVINFYYTFSQSANPLTNRNAQWFYGTSNYTINVTEPTKPTKPTDDAIPGIVDNDAVKVHCTNSAANHTEISYSLKPNSYTVSEVEGDATNGYTCTITVQSDEYVSAYNKTYSGHTLDGSPTGTIKLKWNENKWKVDSGVPVVFNVKCDNTQPPLDKTITIEVSKIWEDDIPGARSITVGLYANGTKVDKKDITPNEGIWYHNFGPRPLEDNNGRDISYTIVEEPIDGYTPHYYTSGEHDKRLVFRVKNVPTEKTGAIKVSKELSGEGAEKDKEFAFTVTLLEYLDSNEVLDGGEPGYYPLSGIYTFGGFEFRDGKVTFGLKGGESVTISGIPAEYDYTVTESNNAGYTVTSENDKGTIRAKGTAEVKFTNTKSAAPTVSPTPTPTPGGGNGGGGHYHPTTPVPVIVIPPKTGDMTIWQSILHFLGIR